MIAGGGSLIFLWAIEEGEGRFRDLQLYARSCRSVVNVISPNVVVFMIFQVRSGNAFLERERS